MSKIIDSDKGFTVIELLVVIVLIATLIALLMPAVQQAREMARKAQCANNLKQLGIALHNYHDAHRGFPPGFIAEQQFPGSSHLNQFAWGTFLLPSLEQANLYEQFNFQRFVWDDSADLTTAAETNQDFAETVVPVYLCPTDSAALLIDRSCGNTPGPQMSRSNYAGVEGTTRMVIPCWSQLSSQSALVFHPEPAPCENPNGMFFLNSFTRLRDVLDGTSTTLAIGEISGKLNRPQCICCPDSPWAGLSGQVCINRFVQIIHYPSPILS